MLELGREAYLNIVTSAREKGHMTTLRPYQKLMQEWLPEVSKGIKEWRKRSLEARGPKPIAISFIKDADADVLSMIGLRVILNQLADKRPKVMRCAVQIGLAAEHELKVRAWEAKAPDSFKAAQRYFNKEGSSPSHRGKGNVILFNRMCKDGSFADGWDNWPEEVHFRVGVTLLDILVRHTGWFSIEHDDSTTQRSKRAAPLVISPKPGLIEWLAGSLDDCEERATPQYMPTVIPPKPWETTRDGGYWTPYVQAPRLIAFKAQQYQQRAKSGDEYDALDMPNVYSATNRLQAVPWSVNRHVLWVASACLKMDLGVAKLPALTPTPNPARPEEITEEWRREAREIKHHNNALVSRLKATESIIKAARNFSEFERFYYPHKLDFRGRAYCIPGMFQPQGHDLARGLLLFANAKPILKANRGDYWLALQVANMMGRDKIPSEERVEWVHENRDQWRLVAKDPVANHTVWSRAKKPWEALAAILDWAAYLEAGEGYTSRLPILVDGTCNGLQHLSAMIRDHLAAPLVNLTPGDRPADIYATAAEKWMVDLAGVEKAGGEDGHKAGTFLRWSGGHIPREATKRQVMVLPYGGTREAFFGYTKEWLDDVYPQDWNATTQEKRFRFEVIGLASRRLWGLVVGMLPGAMAVMEWLQKCAQLTAEGNQPIYWVAPGSGFVVRHFYGLQREKVVEARLDGSRVQFAAYETTKDLDIKAQTRGVPPNFVHSLDAAALAQTINASAAQGITDITAIHDAYGTHAGSMDRLAVTLREAFIGVHTADPLAIFWRGCKDVLIGKWMAAGSSAEAAAELAERLKPPMPAIGTLNLDDIRRSTYFFS